jgi:hypothetical protein
MLFFLKNIFYTKSYYYLNKGGFWCIFWLRLASIQETSNFHRRRKNMSSPLESKTGKRKDCIGVFPKTGITRFRLAYDSLRNTAYCEYPTASPVALLHLKVPDFCVPTWHGPNWKYVHILKEKKMLCFVTSRRKIRSSDGGGLGH